MLRANLVPPAPDEIQGQPLKVEYISSLAQAQRAVDTRGIERLTQYQAGLVQAGLSDGKKFNSDAAVQEYANLVGTPPQLISPDEQVAAQRQQEAEAAQIAQQMELAGQAAAAGAAAGQIDLDGNNPVSAVVNNG